MLSDLPSSSSSDSSDAEMAAGELDELLCKETVKKPSSAKKQLSQVMSCCTASAKEFVTTPDTAKLAEAETAQNTPDIPLSKQT
jgi:hypothetical protein